MNETSVNAHKQESVPVMLVLQPPTDEQIKLIDLWQVLLRRKMVVFVAVAIALIVSVAYAMLATPIYQAKAFLLPPLTKDVENLRFSAGRQAHTVTTDAAYSLFLQNLESKSLRRKFFDSLHLVPPASSSAASAEGVFNDFNQAFSVATKGNKRKLITLSFRGRNASVAAQRVNGLVAMANKETVRQLIQDASSVLEDQKQMLEDSIDAKRKLAAQRKADKIVALQEAASIARSAGISKPMRWGGTDSPIYMRGYKALDAETKSLLKRKNDDAFIQHLRDLQERLSLLKAIRFDPSQISTVTVDQRAITPIHRIAPRRKRIVLMGLLLGLGLGLVAAFLIEFVAGSQAKDPYDARISPEKQ